MHPVTSEQARGNQTDRRSDIFSFGVVLFEMLTGRQLFRGETVSDILASVLKDAPDLASVPEQVRPLLTRCLEKDPKQRLQAIGDWDLLLSQDRIGPQNMESGAALQLRQRSWLPWCIVAFLLLALIPASILHFRETPEPRPLVRFTVPPPADAIRHAGSGFAISPDGQLLAFIAEGSARVPLVYVRHIDSPDAQPLVGTESATDVFWAPDSRSLGFGKDGGLYRSDLGVGPPKRLCDIPGNILTGASWSQNGLIVFSGSQSALFGVADTGGIPSPLTTLDAAANEVGHFGPWFLPDGRHLLFLALAAGQTSGTIWATSIDNRARTGIAESSGPAAYADGWLLSSSAAPRTALAQPFDPQQMKLSGTPQPVRDRLIGANTFAERGFSLSNNGTLLVDRPAPLLSQLTWMDRTGHPTATLGMRASIQSFALAPDQRRAVAEIRDNDAAKVDLWLFDGEKESAERLTYEQTATSRPLWALDGRHIYLTQRTGALPFGLRTIAIGAATTALFENAGPFSNFEDVTRDGKYIVFRSLKLPFEIWIQRVGSTAQRALVQGQFAALQPRVSADSRWLAYTLQLPTGSEVFVQPFDRPGERIQVSAKGGFGPVWRDDGRELYFEGPEGLMAVPMTERNGALEAGKPQKLFSIHTQGYVPNQPHNVEVAARGQKFLVNSIVGDSDNVPLEVTLNWQTGLKK